MSHQLLDCWRNRDLKGFKDAVKDDDSLNYLYPEEGYTSLLDSIAATVCPESADFATILIGVGAIVDLMNPMSGKAALHVAAEALNRPVLEVLLSSGADVNLQDMSGSTALHILARKVSPKFDKAHEDCLDLLLSRPDLYLNHNNNKGLSPVLTAYEQGAWRVMLKLLKAGAYVENIDYATPGKKSLREEVKERCPEILDDLPPPDLSTQCSDSFYDINKLLPLLKNSSEDRFCYCLNMYMVGVHRRDLLTTREEFQELLHRAIQQRLLKAVKSLLKHLTNDGTDTKLCSLRQGLHTACHVGDSKIVQAILEVVPNMAPDEKGRTALHILAEVEEFTEDHAACLKLLQTKIDVNATDYAGRTPLHLAARKENFRAFEILLYAGSNMLLQDKTGFAPFQAIDKKVLSKFLDSHIEKQKGSGEFYFDLEFLNSNQASRPEAEVFLGPNETKNMNSPSTQPQLHDSLPLFQLEMKQLQGLMKSDLLSHPVFHVFISYKWKLVTPIFYIHLINYFLFWTSLLLFLSEDTNSGLKIFLKVIIIVYLTLFYIQIFSEVAYSPFVFLTNPCRWPNVFLTVLVTIVISCNLTSSSRLFLLLSSLTILFSSFKFLQVLRCHPQLAVPIHQMLTLFWNSSKIIAAYVIVLFSFSLMFSLLSRLCHNADCTTFFIFGFLFEIPLLHTGQGYKIETTTQLPFLLFVITLLTISVHLVGSTVAIMKKTNAEIEVLKAQVKFISSIEQLYIEILRSYINALAKHLPFKRIGVSLLDKVSHQILFFAKNRGFLRMLTHENNIITNLNSNSKKKTYWDIQVQIPPNVAAEISRIVNSRQPTVIEKEIDKNDAIVTQLMKTTEVISERIRQAAITIEKLEIKSKEIENLLIQSLRISNLRNDE